MIQAGLNLSKNVAREMSSYTNQSFLTFQLNLKYFTSNKIRFHALFQGYFTLRKVHLSTDYNLEYIFFLVK